jgi:hypothetical protein
MAKKVDLSGQEFDELRVLRFLGSRKVSGKTRRIYLVRCSCGYEFEIAGGRLTRKEGCRSKSCTSCKYKKLTGPNNSRWRGCGEISGNHWDHILRGARDRNFAVEITIEDAWLVFLNQERRCALTGQILEFTRGKRTASLDRIDSKKGYVDGNIQWIHKDVNRAKQHFDESRFIEICKMVADYRRSNHVC